MNTTKGEKAILPLHAQLPSYMHLPYMHLRVREPITLVVSESWRAAYTDRLMRSWIVPRWWDSLSPSLL